MEATPSQLNTLFPHPGHANITHAPATRVPGPVRQAGWTDESTQVVVDLLKDNHQKWHIFFNDLQFHNHAAHHLLAIYAIGADGELLNAAYATHTAIQRPAFPPPEKKKLDQITDSSNWKDHLGDERYYQGYVAFFTSQLTGQPDAIKAVLEDYVFSKDANTVAGDSGKAPMMLSRFLGGFLHPLIHCGYGAEFGLPGLIAEGIAEATSQDVEATAVFPPSLFEGGNPLTLTSPLASLALSASPSSSTTVPVTALAVLARVAKDPAFLPEAIGLPVPSGEKEGRIDRVVRVAGEKLLAYAGEWTAQLTGELSSELLAQKFEEVVWMNTVIYAVAGWAGRKQSQDDKGAFNGDFFFMHLVTSALLMPALLNTLTPPSASLLLRTYFTCSLALYVSRGRPPIPISAFYSNTSARPQPPSSSLSTKPAKDTLPPHFAPNPWLPIIQTTLVHPNEHYPKLQRALWHFADVYGGRAKGRWVDDDGVESVQGLQGLKALDGTLFVRAAGLTADRLGWMREGEEQRTWDRIGFYKDVY